MSDLDDVELARLALDGDPAARRELGRRLLGAIQREVSFALVRFAAVGRRDARQDVLDQVQDVLVALFENGGKELRRWDPERGRSLESFVRLVARRRVSRTLSKRQGNPWSDDPTDPREFDGDDDADLARRLEHRSQLGQLLGALHSKMGDRDHELFDLLFVQELGPEEVAQRVGLTRGAVNAWAYRIRKLARSLASALDDRASSGAAAPAGKVQHV